ncbi:MAG TPA: hypothetical protein VFM96_11800 [Gaiellaceae bacterium]|nr:hypothetical protein [Gaiellaceae bacterium]
MARSHPLAREALLSAGAAATIAALLAWLGPPGSDLAAHAYQRTLFLEHGFTLWNNFWYAGRYSFVTYSVIYYPLAAWFGIKLLAVATIALAASAFTVLIWSEWGPTTRWSSRTFAVVWAGIVLSAAFPFALGMAFALLALGALQASARWRFAALATLTLAASPVAFLLLVIVLGGIALARREALKRNWVPIAALGVITLVELLLWRIFPGTGRFPFHSADAIAGAGFCIAGLAFTWRVERARVLRFVFAVYLLAVLAVYAVPGEIGGNIARMRYAAIPLAVLVFSLRRWRPLALGVVVVAAAVAWNISPLVANYVNNRADATAQASVWPAAITYLKSHLTPSYRVEAVDTAAHWPAVYLADASIPLARGWFRQDDFPQNAFLYKRFGAAEYLQWLRSLGVRYVVLSRAPLDYSSRTEAKLVRSGRIGFSVVFRSPELTIYAVPHPVPIVTGAGSPTLFSLTQARIGVDVHRGGLYRIAVRYSPYWHASNGCLSQGSDGMLRLRTRTARMVTIVFDVNATRAFDQLAGERPSCTLP